MADPAARPHHWPADGACANCNTPLMGDWCHACGQRAEDHHHSLRHLALETIESFTHADGRLWRTLSLLVSHPARLTRDYLDGRRAREIPPLRLYFVMLLLVFASGALGRHIALDFNPADIDKLRHGIDDGVIISGAPRLSNWLRLHLLHAADDPRELLDSLREWGERFAFLLAPLSALVLRLLFPLRRDMKLFDHAVFALHSLSFVGMAWVALMLCHLLHRAGGWFTLAFVIVLPLHLFVHMRGVYRTGTLATLARMALLFVLTQGIFALLLFGLALVSLGSLGA